MLKAKMSFAVTVVVVKSVNVVDLNAVLLEIETPLVLIESELVGLAVPVAFFHVFTVAVPVSITKLKAEIVAAYGQTKNPLTLPVVSPLVRPIEKPTPALLPDTPVGVVNSKPLASDLTETTLLFSPE